MFRDAFDAAPLKTNSKATGRETLLNVPFVICAVAASMAAKSTLLNVTLNFAAGAA